MRPWLSVFSLLLACTAENPQRGSPPPGEAPDPRCSPACEGRICGDDGCDGACGACSAEAVCSADGACVAPPRACGDGACGADEDCATCPADCGACCGDGACRAGETCVTCPADCGCGPDARCEETSRTCVDACTPACDRRVCGDDGCGGECGTCEAARVCSAEGRCVDPPRACGDAACDPDEDCATCPADCGACPEPARCGDGACDPDEDCATCPADCGACPEPARCGDAACDPDEDCATCPDDCGACPEPARCAWGETVCEPDGVRGCGPDAEAAGGRAFGAPAPCQEGRACADGRCAGEACAAGRLMVLVDRSAATAGQWPAIVTALREAGSLGGGLVELGLRAFPDQDEECAAGDPSAFASTLGRALDATAPPVEGPVLARPLGAALAELDLGPRAEARAVVLLTAGADTCAEPGHPIEAVAALLARGVRTYVVALQPRDLAPLATAGGTGAVGVLPGDDAGALRAAFERIYDDLDLCRCPTGEIRCIGPREEQCDGRTWAPTGGTCEVLSFAGVRRELPLEEVEAGGFQLCHDDIYPASIPLEALLDQCAGDVLLLGCRRAQSDVLDMAAMGERDEVTREVGPGEQAAHLHNGARWYFERGAAWGFSPGDAEIRRRPCDVSGTIGRLCWRLTDTHLAPGERCGPLYDLFDERVGGARAVRRVIYHRPGPL